MPQPRKTLISLSDTPFYHCMSRCVRRAFLCGEDSYSGINYEHRRDWLESLLLKVADVFAIKLCAYAIMHNHYHVVLNVRTDLTLCWSNKEVVRRWHELFAGNAVSRAFHRGMVLDKNELLLLNKDIDLWRQRLSDISWFMRIINERIARQANNEDQCTGRFWEGRFKSQALLDDKALLACMAYVDLNPIRAGIAETPETSDHTAVKSRINKGSNARDQSLEQFVGNQSLETDLPFKLADYLELVDWTGRIIIEDKRGSIKQDLPPILDRLNFTAKSWSTVAKTFEQHFNHWVGSEGRVKKLYEDKHYQRVPSTVAHKTLLG